MEKSLLANVGSEKIYFDLQRRAFYINLVSIFYMDISEPYKDAPVESRKSYSYIDRFRR